MFKRFTLLFLFLPGLAGADSVLHQDQLFSVTWSTGVGTSVYVVGSSGELGEWNPVDAVKLRYTPGDIWEGRVTIPRDSAVEYKAISRADGKADHCDSLNVVWSAGSNAVINTTASPSAPYSGKTVFYYSSWTNAVLLEVVPTGGVNHAMTAIGPGRAGGETLYRVDGVGQPGQPMEFVFHNGEGSFDNAPYSGFGTGANNYYTPLDVFWLQDGDVFNYLPEASPSSAQVVTGFVNSTATGIPGRNVRVYLPRGYTEHTNRFYPVLYMHDGQNVFTPGGAFGSWDADLTATKEISQGRIRECIIVGINNNANRLNEYLPPSDEIDPGVPGIGDTYVDFLENNVRPFMNGDYRTLTDKVNTFTMGSSMGGLISLYMGVERTGWGRIGVMSPAFWRGVNYYQQLQTNTTAGIDRVYLDWGTDEGTVGDDSNWDEWYGVHDVFVKDGYVHHSDFLQVIGCGDAHNEAAWASRLPTAFRFLLNIQEEANLLAWDLYGGSLEQDISMTSSNTPVIHVTTLAGIAYSIRSAADLSALTNLETQVVESNFPWNIRRVEDVDAGPRRFYRTDSQP